MNPCAAEARQLLNEANEVLANKQFDEYLRDGTFKDESERADYCRGFYGGDHAVASVAVVLALLGQRWA